MSRKIWLQILSCAMMVGMVFSWISPAPTATIAKELAQNSQTQPNRSDPPLNLPAAITTASDSSLNKLDKNLQGYARSGGTQIVNARFLTAPDFNTWPNYVQAVPLALPDDDTGLSVWYGRVQANNLAKLASLKGLVYASVIEETGAVPRFRDPDQAMPAVTDAMRARIRDLRDHPTAKPVTPEAVTGWWDVGPGHESKLAWDKGFTGAGVTVADIDSGVDFCHPDLAGTWKTYDVSQSRNYTYADITDYLSYYDGWPEALSPVSNFSLFFDLYFNGEMTDLNTFAYGITKFSDTGTTGIGDVISFDGYDYITSGTAFAGTSYHIGYHPDTSLEAFWWGERIAVLVVDEDGNGIYETVYVDLNDNHDFSDDQPANMQNPTACWDADEDGYNDLSGGMVYFISDGLHWPMMMDWWFDPSAYVTPPGNGDLVAFMFDDPLGPAEAHGTHTASNITGQGRIDGDPSAVGGTEVRPPWKPGGVGGMVQGGGKDAKLIPIGDIYWNFEASTTDAWYFSAFGVDGYGDTDDGAQITSNSYGISETDNDEWDNRSRLITRINTRATYRGYPNTFGQRTAFLVSTGNGAPGYGTVTSADASTSIGVGASTQFGSTNWDSLSSEDQIVWGDVIPWSNRGPTAVGHLAPQVTADGAFAAGDLPSNGWGDGWTAWETWGGTSRSAPVAAGNLALVYDAWYQRTGDWPTWEQARELLMNGANDQDFDVLDQGAGAVNADRSTDIAAGLFGVKVSPSAWYPGTSPGAVGEPIAFAQVIGPGGSDSQVFSVENDTLSDVAATLDATYLTKISSDEFDVTADTATESAYSFNRPDYLFDVSQYAPLGIPAGTALMVAEVMRPFSEFDPGDDNNDANTDNFRVLWYSWDDINTNLRLWQDTDANHSVSDSEIDTGEYIRFTYGYGHSPYVQASIKDPLTRWKSGIFLGLQHRNRINPTNHLTIRVTYYQKSSFDWLSFTNPGVNISAGTSAPFTANVNVPLDTPYGIYQGAIELSVPDDGSHADYHSVIPVVINVAYTGDLQADTVTLGGQPKQPTRYDNSFLTGAQDWSWRAESGDWRFYYLNQTTEPVVNTTETLTSTVVTAPRIVVRDQWDDPAPQTDIDTLVFGPTNGPYTLDEPPYEFNFGDFSVTDPATFGPYRLEPTAGSENHNTTNGVWAFQTASGSNVEYVTTPLQAGLNEVVQHSVRWQGDKFDVPFTKNVSTLTGPTSLLYTNYFEDNLKFSSTVTHTLTVEAYGLSNTGQEFNDLSIHPDPTNGDFCDFAAGGIYTYATTLVGTVAQLTTNLTVGSNDLDLFLLYDSNGDGAFSCPSDTIASSTQGAGADEEISLNFPSAGNYMVVVQGWAVSPDPSLFSWSWTRTDLDDSIRTKNAKLTVGPGDDASFDLYNAPGACDNVVGSCKDGIIFVGFSDAPRLFSIPVTVNFWPGLEVGWQLYLPFNPRTAP